MEQQSSNKNLTIGIIVFVILAAGAWYVLGGHSTDTGSQTSSTTPTAATSTEASTKTETAPSNTVSVGGVKGATIKEIPTTSTASDMPNLDRTPNVTKNLSADQKTIDLAKIAALTGDIKKNPDSLGNWIALGAYYEGVGDYTSAEEIWTYAAKAWPTNAVALNNLGSLYRYDVSDYAKSEQSYLGAIKVDPSFVDDYMALYQLYIGPYNQKKDQAPVILKEGVKNNPSDLQLVITLAEYYQKQGDKTQARTYFTQALDIAQKTGNTDAEASIKQELNDL